jgi:hypothetical protein
VSLFVHSVHARFRYLFPRRAPAATIDAIDSQATATVLSDYNAGNFSRACRPTDRTTGEIFDTLKR